MIMYHIENASQTQSITAYMDCVFIADFAEPGCVLNLRRQAQASERSRENYVMKMKERRSGMKAEDNSQHVTSRITAGL